MQVPNPQRVRAVHLHVRDRFHLHDAPHEPVTCTSVEEVAAVLRECRLFREGVYRDRPLKRSMRQEKKSPTKDSEVTDMRSEEEPNENAIDHVQAMKAEGVMVNPTQYWSHQLQVAFAGTGWTALQVNSTRIGLEVTLAERHAPGGGPFCGRGNLPHVLFKCLARGRH